MDQWQMQTAKAKLSELVQAAQTAGPQLITKHGRKAAYVISPEQYEKPGLTVGEFWDLIRKSPLVGSRIKLERNRSPGRKVRL